jgi:hypothetical protein
MNLMNDKAKKETQHQNNFIQVSQTIHNIQNIVKQYYQKKNPIGIQPH